MSAGRRGDTLPGMSRALREPRIRVLAAAVIVLLVLALSWHLVAMGMHGIAMMLGFCVAVLALVVLPLPGGPVARAVSSPTLVSAERPRGERIDPLGRHPPDDGIRLRH
jgi:hypothetical protein